VGVLDRRALAELAAELDDRIQLPEQLYDVRGFQRFAALARTPIYVAADVDNQAALAATLVAARAAANAAAPGMLVWGEHSTYRGSAVVEVRGPKVGEDTPALYYAIAGDVFVAALGLDTLHVAVDRVLDERAPTTGGDMQFVVDVAAGEGQGLSTTLGWLFHAQALESQPAALVDAEALLRGLPGLVAGEAFDAAAWRTFGTLPVDAGGSSRFELGPTGAISPELGSLVRPHFPALPIAGSPAHAMTEHLRAFRAEVAFEPEPGDEGKSLKIHVELRTRG
jgi:hypothetical protein